MSPATSHVRRIGLYLCHDGWLRCGNLSLRTVAYRYPHHNVYPPLSVFQETWNVFSLCKVFRQHLPQLCLCMWVENCLRLRRPCDAVLATPSVNWSLECSCDTAHCTFTVPFRFAFAFTRCVLFAEIEWILHFQQYREMSLLSVIVTKGHSFFIRYVILVWWINCVIESYVSLVTLVTFIIHPRFFVKELNPKRSMEVSSIDSVV
jgi:hypothetical protein